MLDYVGKEEKEPRPSAIGMDAIAGENLRRMRIARGFSQERLGEAMGISFQAVQKHEAGRTKWSVARALQYAEVLNVKVEDIFRGTDVFAERDVKPIELELSQKAIELAMMHDAIVDPAQQAALRNLARTMAKAED